jgi:cellulose biosynthesis protein BcsQ
MSGKRRQPQRFNKSDKRTFRPEGIIDLTAARGKKLFERNCTIAIYSHKGGVGKTTTALHLARSMLEVNSKEKILLVDMDPQMNLTQQLCAMGLRYKDRELLFDNVVEKISNLDYSTNEFMSTESPDVITAIAKAEKDPSMTIELKPASCCLTNLHSVDCMIGNMDHSHVLYNLTRERTNNTPSHMFGAVKRVMKKFLEEYGIVVVDLPPDMFELNKTLLRCSDYIVTILNTDVFALATSRMIHRKLICERNRAYYSELNEPHLLGFVMNRVKHKRGVLVAQNQKHKDDVSSFWAEVMKVNEPALGCIPDFETQLKKETEDNKCLVNDINSRSGKSKIVIEFYESMLQRIISKIIDHQKNQEEGELCEAENHRSSCVFD